MIFLNKTLGCEEHVFKGRRVGLEPGTYGTHTVNSL